MTKIEIVRKEMMQAMKDKNKTRKEALSSLLSALKAKFIDKRADLTEEEENTVVLREIKQMQETIDTSPKDRKELIQECKEKIKIYSEFAPQQMDEDQIRDIINVVLKELNIEVPTLKDKGLIMKSLMPRVKGKADGAMVNNIVGDMLN